MRSSAVLVLAVLAVASPALSAPAHIARQAASSSTGVSSSTSSPGASSSAGFSDGSGALSLGSIASSIVSVIQGILGGSSSQSQRRELSELLARADADAIGARALVNLLPISHHLPKFQARTPAPNGNLNQNNFRLGLSRPPPQARTSSRSRREALELLARQQAAPAGGSEAINIEQTIESILGLLKREDPDASSGALSFSDVEQAVGSILGFLKREDTAKLLARTDADESGAISFSDIAQTIGSVLGFLKREDVAELLARQDTDPSGALSLGTVGTIASLGGSVLSGLIDHFKGGDQQSREFVELLARDEGGLLNGLRPFLLPAGVDRPVARSLNDMD